MGPELLGQLTLFGTAIISVIVSVRKAISIAISAMTLKSENKYCFEIYSIDQCACSY